MTVIVPDATIPALSVEALNREYAARLAQAARAQFTNETILTEWRDYYEAALAASTRPGWVGFGKHLAEWLTVTGKHVLTVSRREATEYVSWLERGAYSGRTRNEPPGPGHVNNHLIFTSRLYDYLREARGLVQLNPFEGVVRRYMKQHRRALQPDLFAPTEEEAVQVLEGCETLDEFTLVLVLAKTGVRRSECRTLRMDRIDWTNRYIEVDAHPKRTYLQALFDEETEYFLRLKCERNARDHPGNPYLFPSSQIAGAPLSSTRLWSTIKRAVRRGALRAKVDEVGLHTWRRAFTSMLKRHACPEHIVAVLRGDSLRSASDLVHEPTQGTYTKFGTLEGVGELRYWYDKTMPKLDARRVWARARPSRANATDLKGLMRAMRNGQA